MIIMYALRFIYFILTGFWSSVFQAEEERGGEERNTNSEQP